MNEVTLFLPVPRFHITEVIHLWTYAPTNTGWIPLATGLRVGRFLEHLFLKFDAGFKHTRLAI